MWSSSIIAIAISFGTSVAATGGFQVNAYEYGCGNGYVGQIDLDDWDIWTSCTSWGQPNAWYLNVANNWSGSNVCCQAYEDAACSSPVSGTFDGSGVCAFTSGNGVPYIQCHVCA
ncbi:hypothetical protein ACQKWADRAFT_306216 [Trichoderma austrokoningii]